jgi:hypothetical protein
MRSNATRRAVSLGRIGQGCGRLRLVAQMPVNTGDCVLDQTVVDRVKALPVR